MENIFSVLEESIFLGKVSVDVGEEKESFAVVAEVWETCDVEEEEQEKESVVFWWEEGRDFSSVYYHF